MDNHLPMTDAELGEQALTLGALPRPSDMGPPSHLSLSSQAVVWSLPPLPFSVLAHLSQLGSSALAHGICPP